MKKIIRTINEKNNDFIVNVNLYDDKSYSMTTKGKNSKISISGNNYSDDMLLPDYKTINDNEIGVVLLSNGSKHICIST